MFVHPYVDESYDLAVGVYILTASVVDLIDAEDIRCTMRGLRRGGEKLHWSKEPPHRRVELTKAFSSLMVHNVVVIGSSTPLFPERARRKCLEVLLPDLEVHGAEIVTFETRQKHSNKLDADMVDVADRSDLLLRISE
ncbi:hypothetical protein OU415_12800 [Saccharopolyspora sp. WRP15-2]|uniref:Uncharacterized protein n=1 Tax=Saccharopolyspora oryzae TaxID=2997343 RepID=A0ABT4UX84_9PSEU|nr:hypothetical protein [Saccharopolyspora oryzae]MDA3626321.1 hypothetical protein [Saccharopolyspora oryzae]